MRKEAFSFVLFGATGDLVKRKIVPALADLVKSGILNKKTPIIGVSRRSLSDSDYKKFLVESLKDKKKRRLVEKLNIKYYSADFSKKGGLKDFEKVMESAEEKKACNRIFYLATSFRFFPDIVSELKSCCVIKKKNCFNRIVFEKPFGNDLKSATKLNSSLNKVFPEKDIYRIDHYLAKETVQNLNVLKFTNPILYSTLNNKFVESIEVIIDENFGVGKRMEFYNETGAIKDMIQSHHLQVLSMVLMSRPNSFSPEKIHDEKVKVLKKIVPLSPRNHLIGQYRSYSGEAKKYGIKKSRTETFAKVALNCKTPEWDGVKIYLRTGKKLKKKFGQIRINFKPSDSGNRVENNRIIINIYPKQDVFIELNTKNPFSSSIERVDFEFCRECLFGPNTPDEYSTLIAEVVKGDKTLFTRDDEIRESWRIVDKLESMKGKMRFKKYKDYSDPEKR